jgi:segregation and condensation protein B
MTRTPDPPFQQGQQGVSLDELAQAFAEVMGSAPRPQRGPEAAAAEAAEQAAEPAAAPGEAAVETPPPEDDASPPSPRSILEAMLFVGNRDGRPLSAARAAELMRGVEAAEVGDLVDQLNQRYAAGGCPYQIVQEADGYRLTLRKDFHSLRDRFYGRIREARLSQAAIDVLAVVAYQQPLTAEQVSGLRGKPSGHILSQLVHRGLLRIERQATQRHAAQYFTTDRFLHLFALESLTDLPQSEELG